MNTARYIRQTNLKEFGPGAQKKLQETAVLVVGAGGLGLPVLLYLNAMGIGTLGIVEQDVVALSNLQRQVLYNESDIGKSKLDVVLEKLEAQNAGTKLIPFDRFLVRDNALEIISEFDIVVDATDNFPTRYLINDACVILDKPFVYGALHGFEGQISVFNYQKGPTYRCLFPEMPATTEIPDCNVHGVLGVIPGIVGNLQALEVVKVITEIGEVMSGKLLLFNGLNNKIIHINITGLSQNLTIDKLQENYQLPACGSGLEITPEQLFELIEAEKKIQIIDVRTQEEFQQHHIPKAINIPLAELNGRQNVIDQNNAVYLICQSGSRSRIAQQTLVEIDPKYQAVNVIGGMNNCSFIFS